MATSTTPHAPATEAIKTQSTGAVSRAMAQWSVIVGYVIMVVIFAVLRPSTFPTWGTFLNLLDQAVVPAILVCGLTLIVSVGEFDLSFTGTLGLSAGVVIVCMATLGIVPLVAIAITIAVAVAIGLGVGYLATFGKVNSFILTLAISSILVGAELALTGNTIIFANVPAAYTEFGRGSTLGLRNPVWVALVIVLISIYLLHFTRFGRHVFAVGSNSGAAKVAGVPVRRVRIAAFTITAFLAGVSAILLTSTAGSYFPNSSGGYLLSTYAAVFLGAAASRSGRFSTPGSVFGVLWLLTLQTGLTQLNQPAWASSLFQGLVLSAAVLLTARARSGER